MPEYLEVEPEQLRMIAEQHMLAAAKIRKWGEIPHAWLADFHNTYGTIAEPVRASLVEYYYRRHEEAERLAADHERSRDALLATATALEDADQVGRRQIIQAGGFDDEVPLAGPAPGARTDNPAVPVGASRDTPMLNATRSWQPSVTTLDTVPGISDEAGRSEQAPLPPATPAPHTYDTVSSAATAPKPETMPPSAGGLEPGAADMRAATAVDADSAAGLAGAMPAPLATGPLVAAVQAAGARRALPSLVVGERVDEDLALARTLLAATLAAVADSAPGLEWAVAVARTPAGPLVMLTSSEGRGWLPAGLFLPSEVTLPWKWDSLLDMAGREAIARWEGTADPARMLAEFGLLVGRRRRVRISALVSSASIPDGLFAALGDDVAIEGWVSAAESVVDLTAPGVGLVDRLALAGSDELLRQAATVPNTEIRAKCLELAWAADALVGAAVSGIDGKISTHRVRRREILDALHSGVPVPASWWDQIRAFDDMAAAALRAQHVDVSHFPVGVGRDVVGTEALLGVFFQRRADEMLLMLAAGEPDRQNLRDALYAYGQIVEHPRLPVAARAVAARAEVRDIQGARSVSPGARGVSAISVGAIGLAGVPPPIAALPKGPAGSESSSEQMRAMGDE
ncbi:hypothetical protein IFM12275_23950 [Nocardia sputorum]|uniref:type VII secretion target n=1 Tax=Nocardia sputorum TaxID=2984338 RepID=UPI002491A351|nr:type VII secretion target [Nocardia sputorum]BDT92419.1 hypothetical protein IFM12275_23950 [Nocardia sputorum]